MIFRKRGKPDPDAFFAEIVAAQTGRYPNDQRYREFRQVFMGSEAGKRVLWTILGWGHLFGEIADPNNVNETFLKAGQRALALQILDTINAEPTEQPEQTVRQPEGE